MKIDQIAKWGCCVTALSMLLVACDKSSLQIPDPALSYINGLNDGTPEFTEGYVELGAVRLHYVEAGEGPLIIFYHGFPSYWLSFLDQMKDLSKNYRVVAVDGLGAHFSSIPDDLSLYRIDELAGQLDQLAQHLAGDEPFILVGHDWGGALAWAYATAYPERLQKVIVLSAPNYNQLLGLLQHNEEQRARSSYMYELRQGPRHKSITENGGNLLWERAYAPLRALPNFTEEQDELFRQALSTPGAVDGGLNWYRANVPPLEEIDESVYWPAPGLQTGVPGLLIWGENDKAFIKSYPVGLAEYVRDLTVLKLQDTGHWPMIERPQEVNRAIRKFLGDPTFTK